MIRKCKCRAYRKLLVHNRKWSNDVRLHANENLWSRNENHFDAQRHALLFAPMETEIQIIKSKQAAFAIFAYSKSIFNKLVLKMAKVKET